MNQPKQLRQKCGICGKNHNTMAITYLNGYETFYILFSLELTLFSLIKDYFDYKYLLSFKEFFDLVKHIFFSERISMRYDCGFCKTSSHWKIENKGKAFIALDSRQYEHLWSIIHILQNSQAKNKYIWYLEQREYGPNHTIDNPEYLYFNKSTWGDYNTYYNLTYEEACKAYKSYRNNLIFG